MQNKQKNYTIHSMELGPMENFVYLIHDHATNTAAIVDPAWQVDKVLKFADSRNIKITDVLLTHCRATFKRLSLATRAVVSADV